MGRRIRHIHAGQNEWIKVHRPKYRPASSSNSGGGPLAGLFYIFVIFFVIANLEIFIILGMLYLVWENRDSISEAISTFCETKTPDCKKRGKSSNRTFSSMYKEIKRKQDEHEHRTRY